MAANELIPVEKIPELTGIGRTTVEAAIRNKRLRVIRPSGRAQGHRYVTQALIDEWLSTPTDPA